MGGKKSKPKQNNQNVQPISKLPQFKSGERFLIQRRELEKIKDVLGGSQRVELFLSLKKNEELAHIPSLIINVSVSSINNSKNFIDMGKTNYLESNKLDYSTTFKLDYCFEIHQNLKFDVYSNNQFIETIESTLGRIFGARNHIAEFKLNNFPNISVIASVNAINEETANLTANFEICPKVNNNSYYFVLFSAFINNKFVPIYKSNEQQLPCIKVSVPMNEICNGNKAQPIIFEIVDVRIGCIGRYQGSLDEITNSNGLINLNSNISCQIIYKIEKEMKFLDYIQQGLQISVMTAIDFTGSNGDPADYRSKHYIHAKEPNDYEQAISTCCSIVAYYDYDGKFPVYGFGALIPGSSATNHCFPLTFSDNPSVNGVEEIIKYYKAGLEKVRLSGPTYFGPIIKSMKNTVVEDMKNAYANTYYMFLILTDGQINDFDQTANLICECAYLPISFIIIGIGNDDFGLMEQLDGDETPLKDDKGRPCARDIVQFVKINNFKSDMERLSREVLCELPYQIESYFKFIKPFLKPL